MHKADLVWTDLKLDNMVLSGKGQVKAIDLESAVPARSVPKTFSPEATPPDFFAASRNGVSAFALRHVSVISNTCRYFLQTLLISWGFFRRLS